MQGLLGTLWIHKTGDLGILEEMIWGITGYWYLRFLTRDLPCNLGGISL